MSTEEKQNFLREKILDKGYDTNQFVQFLTSKKGEEGADVANWTMEDLITVVNEFIKLNGGTEEIEEKQEKQEEPKKESKKKVSMFDVMSDLNPKKSKSEPTQNQQIKPKTQTQELKKSQNVNQQNKTQNIPKPQNIQKPQNINNKRYKGL